MKDASTRDLLKLAARRLFARRGFDGVTVRDIVLAAGQRNSGSLHYYFGTKDELARELVLDGAKLIDDRRNRQLDELERDGGPTDLRQVIETLVWPSTNLAPEGMEGEDSYIRFITILQMSHRELFLDALEGKWASGYERCLDHIRRLLAGIDPELVNQRLMFMSLYLRATMSSREAALEGRRAHHFWGSDFTMQNLIDTIEGILRTPVSQRTSASLQRERKRGAHRQKDRKKGRASIPA
jgi:AcrR family transcriptional regulator